MAELAYRRVLLKISGEALAGSRGWGLDNETIHEIAKTVKEVHDKGCELAIVVGGGNFWRGRTSEGMDRVTADHMGMLATAMNAMALSDALEQLGATTRVMSAIEMRQITETYIRRRALRHLEKGRIIIFACGTGNPYFSTDSAMALRAAEIEADLVMKATNVDGVYDKDPQKHADAQRYSRISHMEVLQKQLQIMDANAAAICRDNALKIQVFSLKEPQNIMRIVCGEDVGTLVY